MRGCLLTLVSCAVLSTAFGYDIHTKALTPIVEKAKPAGAPMAFVRDGARNFTIVFDGKHAASVRAADLLETCFARTTGTKAAATGAYRIELVPSADPKEQKLGVATTPRGVRLTGNVWYAALDFCERFLGVRWYFPDENGIIYPKTDALTIAPVAYEDEPYLRGGRGGTFYPFTSVETDARRRHWDRYFAKKLQKEDVQTVTHFEDYWRAGGRGCGFNGGHSPRPECLAKSHPDKLRTIFYTSPYGKFWYNPNAHVGNYYNVIDLKFADLLIDDLKAFYESDGRDDRGRFKDTCWKGSVSFGCCDTAMPVTEYRSDPTVKALNLVTDADIARGAPMCNVYARFYQYLGRRIKEEFPGSNLGLLIYYDSQYASLDPRWTLPDNVEVNVCDGRLPGKTRNPKEMEKSVRLFREWYEACGNRPIRRAWLYAARFDRFGRATMPEFIGEVPKVLGKYLSRDGALFYDYDGATDMWHYFYSVYAGYRGQWNPDYDVDAGIAEMMTNLFGEEAGAWMTKFHAGIKDAYIRYYALKDGPGASCATMPRALIDELERDLAEAKKLLKPDSVEMRRFELIADYWPEAFRTQRALADYEPAVYDVKRFEKGMDWSKVADVPMVSSRTGAACRIPSSLKLAWDEKGLHGRFSAPYAPMANAKTDLWRNDGLELFFTPGLGKEQVYQFAYDCLGRDFVSKQRLLPIPQPPDATYKGTGFTHTADVAANGWTSEFFLPWTLFDEPAPKAYDQWNANLVRNKLGPQPEVVSSAFTLGKHANTPMFGIIRFLGKGD